MFSKSAREIVADSVLAKMPEPRPGTETVKVSSGAASPTAERSFLERPALGDEMIPLRGGKSGVSRRKTRFRQMRDREIDIVAAEQDVVAHGDPLDLGRALVFAVGPVRTG